jgi:hypothetical protein
MNTNPHYTFNSIDYKPPELNPKYVEDVQMNKSFNEAPCFVDNYIPHTHKEISKTECHFANEKRNISFCTPEKKQDDSNQNSQNSGSLIKYFKNMFKSGK